MIYTTVFPFLVTLNTIQHGDVRDNPCGCCGSACEPESGSCPNEDCISNLKQFNKPPTLRWESENQSFVNIPKQAVEELIEKGEVEVELTKFERAWNKLTETLPPNPPPEKYIDGRSIWNGADGSTWRYSKGQKKWVQTS